MSFSVRRVFIASLLVVLTFTAIGCSTAYQPLADHHVGYTEEHLGANVYQVSYASNGSLAVGEIQQLMLYRAADLALKEGFSHFTVLDSKYEKNYESLVRRGGAKPAPADAKLALPGNVSRGSGASSLPSGGFAALDSNGVPTQNEVNVITEYNAGGGPANPGRRLLDVVKGTIALRSEGGENVLDARQVLHDIRASRGEAHRAVKENTTMLIELGSAAGADDYDARDLVTRLEPVVKKRVVL